ncbi:MAG: CueP family metal-binding protein [Dermatophilus congolensis]|nr:CueP family metal-binding protein [Dermatophilus congolensis]
MPAPRIRTARIALTASALALGLGLIAGCSSSDQAAQAPATTPAAQGSQTPSAPSTSGPEVEAMLAKYDLQGKDVRAIVDELDQTHNDKDKGLMGQVRQDQLVLRDASSSVSMPMPADATYISIAPFVNQTHDCFFHSLATCQGEMVEKPVSLKVTDASGKVVAEENATTYVNGFVGLWLPRNINGQITITSEGKTATAPLSTAADAPTCVTTIKLS